MTVYSMFATILDYPQRSISNLVGDCIAELAMESPEASAHLIDFQAAIARKNVSQLQEIYAGAFDLRPDCTPNLGYHIFGDDARRGVFLAQLKERMERHGIALGVELPDHISFILQYLGLADEDRLVVIEDCLLPAVAKMIEVIQGGGNPYEHALRALLSLLNRQHEMFVTSVEAIEAG